MTTTLWEHALGSVLLKDNVFLKDSHVDQHRAMRYELQVMGRPKMSQREIKHVSVTKFSPLLKDLYFSDEGIPPLPRISMGQSVLCCYSPLKNSLRPHENVGSCLWTYPVPPSSLCTRSTHCTGFSFWQCYGEHEGCPGKIQPSLPLFFNFMAGCFRTALVCQK